MFPHCRYIYIYGCCSVGFRSCILEGAITRLAGRLPICILSADEFITPLRFSIVSSWIQQTSCSLFSPTFSILLRFTMNFCVSSMYIHTLYTFIPGVRLYHRLSVSFFRFNVHSNDTIQRISLIYMHELLVELIFHPAENKLRKYRQHSP